MLPRFDSLLLAFRCPFFHSPSLYKWLTRLNWIKVGRVAWLKELLDFVKVVNPTLDMISMCWSAIFLNHCTRSILFTLFYKRKEFRKKDFCLVTIPVNPTFKSLINFLFFLFHLHWGFQPGILAKDNLLIPF